ncbi:unnamed protein product [Arctogadus glacialis]
MDDYGIDTPENENVSRKKKKIKKRYPPLPGVVVAAADTMIAAASLRTRAPAGEKRFLSIPRAYAECSAPRQLQQGGSA